ncbi:MAG: cupin domain-containing protein [Spirosomataceae bacterium]
MTLAEKNIISDNSIDWKDLGNGVRRKVMFYDETMMIVKFEFKKDAVGALHSHPHLQISYVASGVFEFNLGGEKKIIRQGDIYNVPSGIEHGIICLEDGILVDVFNPIRQDFLGN